MPTRFAEIKRWAALLGITPSAFLRIAVMEKLARLEQADRLATVEQRLDWITTVVMHLVTFVERVTKKTAVPRSVLDRKPDRRPVAPAGIAAMQGGGL